MTKWNRSLQGEIVPKFDVVDLLVDSYPVVVNRALAFRPMTDIPPCLICACHIAYGV